MKHLINKFMLFLALILFMAGCATQEPYDYSALKRSNPRSILVIPPINNTVEVNAEYAYLSTVSKPLAEKGYYVFPVAVIDNFLKENGLPTPAEMNKIPLDKIEQYIGADSVLYVTIDKWGQSYKIISSVAEVEAKLHLVDVKTGETLWEYHIVAEQASDSSGGLIGALASAVVQQVIGTITDETTKIAEIANNNAIHDMNKGLLDGHYKRVTKESN